MVFLSKNPSQALAKHFTFRPTEDLLGTRIQLVTKPLSSVLMMAVSEALLTTWRHWGAVRDERFILDASVFAGMRPQLSRGAQAGNNYNVIPPDPILPNRPQQQSAN